MKAVILAGGFGTRLRPLSCTRPKLLFPICNRPLLDWTLDELGKNGVKEVVLAVNYMAEAFAHRYGDSTHGMRLFHSKEEKPLGTGGPIKKAEALIGHEEPFIVLNGDILTQLNYSTLIKKHVEKNALATIALHKVKDPSRYGIAELTHENRVVQFVEKPDRKKAHSNLANAGIYVLDPQIFDYIPDGRPVSIEREVFPRLTDEGRLYGYDFQGLWIDIGKPQDYLEANRLMLDTRIERSQPGGCVEIRDPAMVGQKVVVGERSEIGPYAVIGERTILGKEVHIQNSVIFPGVLISNFTSIDGAIIGEDTSIGAQVKIENGCMIGDQAVIQDNVTLTRDVTVCPFRQVSKSVLAPGCLM